MDGEAGIPIGNMADDTSIVLVMAEMGGIDKKRYDGIVGAVIKKHESERAQAARQADNFTLVFFISGDQDTTRFAVPYTGSLPS